MAAPASVDAIEWLRKQIEESAPDPVRAMLVERVNLLMSAEVDAGCGAGLLRAQRGAREPAQRRTAGEPGTPGSPPSG